VGPATWHEAEERGIQAPMAVAGSRIPAGLAAAFAASRIAEAGLIALGVGFVFLSETAGSDLAYLIGWDLLAVGYLSVGFVVVRRRRRRPDVVRPGGGLGRQLLTGARLSFGFTIAASLVGMTSADSVLFNGKDATYGQLIRFFGGIAIVAAWLLLHTGYARFYARRYYGQEAREGTADPASGPGAGRSLEFPRCVAPMATDFLYFSFTLGTSFAVSDVNVTSQAMRWHVMVHSVISFFYNAVVLAVAIGILTGK
jgi:uncharacterized membrane protein